MRRDVFEDIKSLEEDILQIENQIAEYLRVGYNTRTKKALQKLEADLKYLSILANGAPISKNEDRKIMEFLRTHHSYLQKLSVPA